MKRQRNTSEWPHHIIFVPLGVNKSLLQVFYRKRIPHTFVRGLVWSISSPDLEKSELVCIPCTGTEDTLHYLSYSDLPTSVDLEKLEKFNFQINSNLYGAFWKTSIQHRKLGSL